MTADFDEARLRAYLADRLGAAEGFRLDRIAGGQSNPTYFVTWGKARMVLRKQPNGPILKGAHAVDREFRVQQALQPTGVPIARPILFEADAGILFRPPQNVIDEFPQYPVATTYDDLANEFRKASIREID